MTQIFDRDGNIIPVTALQLGPCYVLELKSSPLKVTLGFDPVKESRINKPRRGLFKKVGVSPLTIIREFRSSDNKDYKVGQELKANVFKAGDFVNVTGISIGKGFQGGMKRWNWKGGPDSHGSMHHRRVGSIGSSTFPSRVHKGHHMPGRMGGSRVTIEGLRVMDVDAEKNIILCRGAVPGHKNGYIMVNLSRKKKFKSLDEVKPVAAAIKNPMKQSKAAAKGKQA